MKTKLRLQTADFAIDYLLDNADSLQQPKDLAQNIIHHKYEIEARACEFLNEPFNLENIKDYIKPEHKRFIRQSQACSDKNNGLESWVFKQTCSTSFEFCALAKTKILIDTFQPTLSNYATAINQKILEQNSYNNLIFLIRVMTHQTVRMLVYTFIQQSLLKDYAEDYANKQSELFLYCLELVNVLPLDKYDISDYLPEFHVYKCPDFTCLEHKNYVEKRNDLSSHKCSLHNQHFKYHGFYSKQRYTREFG